MTRFLAFLRRLSAPQQRQSKADALRNKQDALCDQMRRLTWQHKPRAHVERELRGVVLERLRRGV